MTVQETSIPVPSDDHAVALVVDLDGTLCRTDTLHEAILRLAASKPLQILCLPVWLAEGPAGLKARVADRSVVGTDTLPLNEVVIEFVRAAREAGRKTALVSAADHRQVTAVAETLGIFDEAFGSAEGHNLKGTAKATFLTEHFGLEMFDYIGDSAADVPVWSAARNAITVGAGASLKRKAEAANPRVMHIDPPTDQASAMLKALRPFQWSKNFLLFLPMLAAHDMTKMLPAALGFMAFCLAASAVYVLNDLIDLPADRVHPRKRKRPFAAGKLSIKRGIVMASVLLLLALALGLSTGNQLFIGVLALYLMATFAYSLWLKRELLIDIITLAGLYTVRIFAGGAVASVVLSPWLLGFSVFIFLSLAAVKRQAELTDQIKAGRRSSGRAYTIEELPVVCGIAISAGQAAVLVLALYISSDAVQTLYQEPEFLWAICPMLLYWVLRMVMKAHRGEMTDDPIVFAATDLISMTVVICMVIATGLAI